MTRRHSGSVESGPGPEAVPWAVRLAEISGVGVLVLDAGQAVHFADHRAHALLGCRTTRDLSKRWSPLSAQIAPYLEGRPATDDFPAETTLQIPADPSTEPQRLRCRIYAVDEAGFSGHLLLLQNDEQARAIETSLRDATRNRGMASLYRDTAHDLKGMLNVMNLNVELLQRIVESEVGNPAQQRNATKSAEVVRRELQRLDRLIDVLLDRGTLESGSAAVVDVREVCRNLADLVAARCRRQRVATVLELGSTPALVNGFRDRLHAALFNLVINALDAMPEGGTLTLRAEVDREIRISVSDTGAGLDRERAQDVWRLRYTTKPGGTGIGLHVVRSIVRGHGGRVEYSPVDGRGARFTIHLPAAEPVSGRASGTT